MAGFNPYDVLIRPVGRFTSEKVLNAAERLAPSEGAEFRAASPHGAADLRGSTQNANQNKVVFDVRPTASKPEIKRAIEQVYDVKVVRVNTLHTKRGKRAIIKLSEADNAEDIYTRLGQM